MDSRLNPFQDKMEKTLNNLEEEYVGIRAGRANPHILDKLRVLRHTFTNSECSQCKCSRA